MSFKRFLPVLATAGLAVVMGCDLAVSPVTPTASKSPKADKGKKSPSPSASASTAATASATPSTAVASTKPASTAPSVSPSPTAAPGVPATDAEVQAATAFPFTEAGMRWTYKLLIKAGAIQLPGSLVIECQSLTAEGANVRSTFNIDMSKAPLPGASAGGPKTIDNVKSIAKGGNTNPYTQIVGSLFEGQGTTGTTASAAPVPSPAPPVNTKETITVGGKSYQTVRQKFKNNLSGTDVEFDLYMTAAEGMVKEGVKSKKLPATLLPPQAAMLASLGLDMTLELEKKELGTPSTPLPASPGASTAPASASPGASTSPDASASPAASTSPGASTSPAASTSPEASVSPSVSPSPAS